MPEAEKPSEPGYTAIDMSLLGDEHVRKYLETDGEIGYLWNGHPSLLLTTKGRKSGEDRTIPILFTRDGDDFVLIASKGGSPTHPAWYLNLESNPHAKVQVKDKKYDVVAHVVDSPKREQLWDKAAETWPNYNVYVTRTDRRIPVIALTPVKK